MLNESWCFFRAACTFIFTNRFSLFLRITNLCAKKGSMCFHADGTLMFGKTLCLSRGLYPCVQFKGLLIHADCNLICTKTLLVFKRIITRWSMRTDCFSGGLYSYVQENVSFIRTITLLSRKLVFCFMEVNGVSGVEWKGVEWSPGMCVRLIFLANTLIC